MTSSRLRLEWRSPEELAANPANWRTHPQGQTAALQAVIREVGWAGACLYNERTGRLIDGHARKEIPPELLVDGKLPVLIGDWTEEQEKKILLSLDPTAAMAEADKAALERLMAEVETTDAALQSMLDDLATQHGIGAAETSITAEPQTDRAAELQKEWGTALGQIWEIPGRGGVHRLACGDSTKQDQVERLLMAGIGLLREASTIDPDTLRAFSFEAAKDIYRKALEISDFPTALKALRQLQDLAK